MASHKIDLPSPKLCCCPIHTIMCSWHGKARDLRYNCVHVPRCTRVSDRQKTAFSESRETTLASIVPAVLTL